MNDKKSSKQLAIADLDTLVEMYLLLEDWHGWEAAIDKLALVEPSADLIRQIKHRAHDRATEERISGNPGEERRYLDAGEALSILADRIEGTRP